MTDSRSSSAPSPDAFVSPLRRPTTWAEYERLRAWARDEPEAFFAALGARVPWFSPPLATHGADPHSAAFAWYAGGQLNATWMCVDRHAMATPTATAIIWAKDEPGHYERITYGELAQRVARAANALTAMGVRAGDRVAIYLPMMPEVVDVMLACARLGAVHSVVFAGFSAESLRDRIVDAGATVVVTANEGLRGGRSIPLKHTVDAALAALPAAFPTPKVAVVRRTETEVPMDPRRDLEWSELVAAQRPVAPLPWHDAEQPLFALYTSGSTGRPKGVLHTTGGYLAWASFTFELVFDTKPGDVWFCTADVGWITGHTYLVYGPLANGVTTVLFESTPTYPDAGRLFRVVDELEVTHLYTAPTAIRAIARAGDEPVRRYDRKSLRLLGTVGEPINPEVWRWYHAVVGDGRCPVVDTFWQTETGGIVISPIAGLSPDKPGAATLPLPGIEAALVDEHGNAVEGNAVSGRLVFTRGWPGQARTILGDHTRFRDTYWRPYPGVYFTGDGARRDEDGDYWITGRVDDVLNVSGHRLGTAEIESALVAHADVAEAAVVGYPHDLKGTGIHAFVLLRGAADGRDRDEVERELVLAVRTHIGAIASPDRVQIVDGLPKTRSGKIMRRILRKIAEAEFEAIGDVTTLAEPAVVDGIVEAFKARWGRA